MLTDNVAMLLRIVLKLTEVMVSTCRVGVASAKYGEKSVYFDLGEIDNTVGNWDLYGNDDPNRYNGFQVTRTFLSSYGSILWQWLFHVLSGHECVSGRLGCGSKVCNCRRDGTDSCFNVALLLAEDILSPYDVFHVILEQVFRDLRWSIHQEGFVVEVFGVGRCHNHRLLGLHLIRRLLAHQEWSQAEPRHGPTRKEVEILPPELCIAFLFMYFFNCTSG